MSLLRAVRHATTAAVALLAASALAAGANPVMASTTAAVAAQPDLCAPRLLVVSAFPAELDAVLAKATVRDTVVVDGRSFYLGTLAGNDVIMALTGIGPVNARRTTQSAVDHFRCGARPAITGAVFSGVAGGPYIGDVTVPSRWTDDGKNWTPVDTAMFATARGVADSGMVALERDVPLGDPACICEPPVKVTTVHLPHAPQIIVGGNGLTTDPVGGRAFPCVPHGGDVFGCDPCREPSTSAPDAPRFLSGVAPFVDPGFFLGYFRMQTPPGNYVASDEETAEVAMIAAHSHIPFIGFRAASDGKGDPLMLPGFPVQFFFYKQVAADNAAAVAYAFLQRWAAPRTAQSAAGQPGGAGSSSPSVPQSITPPGLPNTSSSVRPSSTVVVPFMVLIVMAATVRRRRQAERGGD
jgi:nucleoside phosphorylase